MDARDRPGWDRYYLNIAREAATRSNCVRRQVGALVVKQKSIISTGYNGTPIGVKNCFEGGCLRCQSEAPPGEGYDTCICVHAEQNAIVLAARHGSALEGGTLYTTLRPCFGCVKEAIQAGIREIVFEDGDAYPRELEDAYQRLLGESSLRLRQHAGDCARSGRRACRRSRAGSSCQPWGRRGPGPARRDPGEAGRRPRSRKSRVAKR